MAALVRSRVSSRLLRGSRMVPAGGRQASGGSLRPLQGVRVLDLTRVLAGPFATMILGDLGAEVIKVERPGPGDDTRAWGPPFVGSESVYFLSVNRNKKSIAVDLKNPRGAEVVLQLAAECDVFVENFLPEKLSQMGLGFDQLIQTNPSIIYCSISGYGQTGPFSRSPGYDSIASAVSGMMFITGPEDGEPVRPGVAMTDLATGLYAHGSIMAALLQRQRTGSGVHIDCNLLSSQVSCLSHIAANFMNAGKEARRWGNAHESIVPYQSFQTKDGHLVVASGNDKQFRQLCQILKMKELSLEPNYKTNKLRVDNRKQLIHTLTQRFVQKTTAEWMNSFKDSGVPVGPVNNMQQVFSHPQVKHNNLIQQIKHPVEGDISVPGPAVRYSNFSVGEPRPPPLIGQHTVEVLREVLSYDDDVIEELLQSCAVAQNPVS